MKSSSKRNAMLLGTALLAGTMAGPAASQEPASSYPSKPVMLVFNTVGTTSADTELRLYQNVLRGISNATLVFDFKAGAGGAIGAIHVMRQKPDGYTYLATASTLLSASLVNKEIGYDVFKDFEPVTQVSKKNFMLLARTDAPFSSVKEFVDYARANPGKLNWSTSGDGSSTHLPGLLLQSATGTDVTFIHYKVSNERLLDLIAGRVDITVGTVLASMGFVKAGKMRPIAVTDSERSPLLPDMPTVAQSGVPGLSDFEYATWLGLFAPAKTPASITGKFTSLLKQASTDPGLVKAMHEADTVRVVSTGDQFRQYLVREHSRLEKAMKTAKAAPGK
jgi:tripartite-type tricarboxylate transporter receptor subunit TctC